jgi:hypothetical protein
MSDLEDALLKLSLKSGDIVFYDKAAIPVEAILAIPASPEIGDVYFVPVAIPAGKKIADVVLNINFESIISPLEKK